MRTAVAVLTLGLLATLFAPTASARPDCIQVYPWSELCEGDVDGFLCAMGVCPTTAGAPPAPGCDVTRPLSDCIHVDCIQVIPWSYLCSGNVQAFVEYWLRLVAPVLA